MPGKHSNLATSTVAVAPSPSTSGTSLTLDDGSDFPDSGWFVVAIRDHSNSRSSKSNTEFCLAERTGDGLTLIRAQFGTTARDIDANDIVYQPVMSPDDVGYSMTPKTGGKFMDFRWGVNNIPVAVTDPPSPDWFDTVTLGSTATCVYSNSQVLAPIPMMIAFNNTSGTGHTLTWADATYPNLLVHYGRFYLYLDVNPSTNIQIMRWNSPTVPGASVLRLNSSGRNWSILNSAGAAQTLNTGGTTSSFSLTAGVHYRIETKVDHPGNLNTVRVYVGHSTTPIDEFYASFNNGPTGKGVDWGNVNSGNLNNKIFRLGAIAGACSDWVGPYLGGPAAIEVSAASGKNPIEISPDGEIVLRNAVEFQCADGGTAHYLYQVGDPIGRWGSKGLVIDPQYSVGNPQTINENKPQDVNIDTQNRRISARAYNARIVNDPPDFAWNRQQLKQDPNNNNFGFVGTGASTTAGSSTVTLSDMGLSTTATGVNAQNSGTINVGSTTGWSNSGGSFLLTTAAGTQQVTFTGTTATSFTGCSAHEATTGGEAIRSVYTLSLRDRGHGIHIGPTATVSGVNASDSATINVVATNETTSDDWPSTGSFDLTTAGPVTTTVTYTGKTATTFTGCSAHPATTGGELIVYTGGGIVAASTDAQKKSGQQYNITEILTPNTVTVTPTPQETASGLVWKIKTFPYPNPADLTGAETGLTVAQPVKILPHAFPFRRAGTITSAPGGGNTFISSGFTTLDVGRFVLLNHDPTIFPDDGCAEITAVSGTTITVDKTVPALGAVAYSLADGTKDGGGIKVMNTLMTQSYSVTRNVCHTASAKMVGGAKVSWFAVDPDVEFDNTGGAASTRNVFTIDGNGEVLLQADNSVFGYGEGSGSTVNQGSGSGKATGVTINTGTGKITTDTATLNAGVTVNFTVTNSLVTIDSVVVCSVRSPADKYTAAATAVTNGTFDIALRNTTAGNLTEAVLINYAIIRGSVA